MKTAKPPAADGAPSLSRRAQPVRQTRINPPRTSSLNRGNSFQSGPAQEQHIDIFPAVTHFTDAISALPKELVRHFTLLKEVDAKIFAPEAALFQLLDAAALKAPAPDPARSLNDASSSVAPGSTPMSAQNSSFGAAVTTNTHTAPSHDGSTSAAAFDDSNMPRRQLFRQTAYKIQEMLVSLEEKNHVISTANDAMHKQLGRIEEIWPHLESEFSEEAKWGSTIHWAYVENRQAKTNNAQAEKSRREGAATLSAAAQQLAEEAAARSSDRKQALAAKKNSKNNAADAEAENKPQESAKKSQGSSKSRKPPAEPAAPVGLGIAPVPPSAAPAPSKRRKVESANANGGAPMERAMSTVFGSNTSKPKTTSPRETPAPETAGKKRKALPTSGSQAKKSKTNAAMSPSVASSPLVGTFPESAKIARNSPVPPPQIPTAPARPASSRARQSSTQSNNVVENARQRPASAASNKLNGVPPGTPDVVAQSNGATKTSTDPKPPKEAVSTAPPTKIEPVEKPKIEALPPPPPPEPVPNGGKKEASTAKAVEEREPKKETTTPVIPPPPPTATVKTKSGRASKPSTPALATFAEAASAARSRPSRNNAVEGNGGSTTATMTAAPTKRSHKKGASSVSAVAAAAAMAAQQQAAAAPVTSVTPVPIPAAAVQDIASNNGTGNNSTSSIVNNKSHNTSSNAVSGPGTNASTNPNANVNSNANTNINSNNHNKSATGAQDDDDDADVDELRYCYCNGVSYGEMVACDGEGCPREWFHLECVGLKVAPKLNAKWYCEDCKRNLRGSERR
ncbi:hypothetical protein B0T24DRAFT_595299 [Lasiosphaeria ovina]|uniref:Chromatin modification-related protein n=1 Tax=Lasiosphaeria ovina TaxID=92902 RepID=A0AAE0K8J3_9PEZI|nr:hypothetical protein B0T24DRAFT_595299 [Lasiosphaeria ovina]